MVFVIVAAFPVKSFASTKVIFDDKRVIVAQDAETEVETEVTQEEDGELVTIEDEMVPLSSTIDVENAAHKMMGGWWLIILAIMSVAGIAAYASRE